MLLLALWVVAAPTKPHSTPAESRPGLLTAKEEHARAEKVVGPENTAHNCAACHMFEDHAWQHTHHFTGFTRRHRTQTAHEILENMEQLSMKRQGSCRQCHYTSTLQDDKLMPQWGVSCESCHGAAKDWVNIHDRIGGDPKGAMLKWGQGKTETPAERDARLSAAEARGMITSRMIYDLASRCFQCHIVSDEQVVNRGKHPADSDFDLVGWSQGEMRHNFVDSRGAPDHPANRQLTPNERRRMYVVGVAVDLEYSLRNVLAAREPDGAFQQVMLERANDARDELAAILKLVQIPELQSVIAQLPRRITSPVDIPANLPARLGQATRQFTARYDGSTLDALDAQISTDVVGTPYRR
jgi:Cytochrome c554 and c-prime